MARENKQDPNSEAVNAELAKMRSEVAASGTRHKRDNSYTKRVDLVTGEVAKQTIKDRGPKHSRA